MAATPQAIQSNGPRLRLTDGKGNWLHFSCSKMVNGEDYSWSGTKHQLANARRTFPLAKGLAVVRDLPAGPIQ